MEFSSVTDRKIASILLIFFAFIYSLIYSGTYLTDDEHLLTSRSLSIAFDGSFNQSRVMGNSRVFAYSLVDPLHADQAANIEPVQGYLGAAFAWLSVFLKTGRIQTMYLVNLWTTAITAMMIYLTVREKGRSKRTGILLALLFGLCTIALPYSRTYFRDTPAMCFLSITWYFATRLCMVNAGSGRKRRGIDWVAFCLFGCISILSKNTTLIAFFILLLEVSISYFRQQRSVNRPRRKRRGFLILAGILIPLFLLWVFATPMIPTLARFSPEYYFELLKFFLSTPHPAFLQALTGPFISPGKSIFIFSPILVLSLISLFKNPKESWSAWLYLVLLVIAQALFYDDEWSGHINWGLRFVLPAIPGLILCAAPILESVSLSKIKRGTVLFLAILSGAIQLLGSLPPIRQYFVEKAVSTPVVPETAMIWDIRQSILFWSLRWLAQGKPVDIALARDPCGWVIVCLIFAVMIFMILIAVNEQKKWNPVPIALVAVICLNLCLPILYRNDPAWFQNRDDQEEIQQLISSEYESGDGILLKSYATPAWDYWMNWSSPSLQWESLPYIFPLPGLVEEFEVTGNPEKILDACSLTILEESTEEYQRIWLILPADSPGTGLGIEKKWLELHSSTSECKRITGSEQNSELCLYQIK